jgi:hypothetical protein
MNEFFTTPIPSPFTPASDYSKAFQYPASAPAHALRQAGSPLGGARENNESCINTSEQSLIKGMN